MAHRNKLQSLSAHRGDSVSPSHKISFVCKKTCAALCCTGATLLTAQEIGRLYKVFPISVGFRKYMPFNEEHLFLLDSVGTNIGRFFIVGDFIAGNWRSTRCNALSENNACSLHPKGLKPMQCSLVPFCALYPESIQPLIIEQRKRENFKDCKGFKSNNQTAWQEGFFVDLALKNAFYGYQRAIKAQKDFMQGLLKSMRSSIGYRSFLSGNGILEAAIPASLYDELFMLAGMQKEETPIFVENQKRLAKQEIKESKKETLFTDAIRELDKITP